MTPEAMRAVNDITTIVRGAEQAAERGDQVGAERLLRQALALQETTLGAQHPDVANTLNNLAIVCEMNNKLADAEACYRRAHAIATANLPPDDPFVAISRDNLAEFCAARGVPLVQTPPAQAAAPMPPGAPPPVKQTPAADPRGASPATPLPSPRASSPVRATVRTADAPPAAREPSHALAIALGLAALLVLLVVGWFLVKTNPDPVQTTSAPPPPEAKTVAPAATPAPAPAPPATEKAPARATRRSSVKVVSAQVCRSLATSGTWTCTPANAEQRPGSLFYYTRVASPTDTDIEHRWYRDNQLHQRVPLSIGANPSGFRTYSRTTVTADHAGTWKVELRSADGQILDEQTFTVR